jgi:hypothetical protein
MKLTNEDIEVFARMADAFVEDGSYLLEENGECPLMRRVLKESPDLESKCPWLVYFLEHGELPRAKRMTVKMMRERNKKSKTMTLSNKVTGSKKKRKAPTKQCPECEEKVHPRKKKCTCGYKW